MKPPTYRRHVVFASVQDTKWICVVSARTAAHAVLLARRALGGLITSTAYAQLEQ
jgi:hypothetical protein